MKFWTSGLMLLFLLVFLPFAADVAALPTTTEFTAEDGFLSTDRSDAWISPSAPRSAAPSDRKFFKAVALFFAAQTSFTDTESGSRLLSTAIHLRFKDLHRFHEVLRL
jgi:hypothetical protein